MSVASEEKIHEAHPQEYSLAISGMTCASCVARVEKKLQKLPGVTARVNLAMEQAHVEVADPEITLDDLITTVEKAGYGAAPLAPSAALPSTRTEMTDEASSASSPVSAAPAVSAPASHSPESVSTYSNTPRSAHDSRETLPPDSGEQRAQMLKQRFLISLLLSLPTVAISMVPSWQFTGWQWVVTALGTLIAFYCGWPFLSSAFKAARHGSSTMDTLVSLGVLSSMLYSYWALFFGGAGSATYRMQMSGMAHAHTAHIFVESAAMIVTFLLLGRYLEARSKSKAKSALRALLELGARSAHRVQRADGKSVDEEIPAENLRVGDVYTVQPGEILPADGVVLEGRSAVNTSMLTGEPVPKDVQAGDEVIGATVNTTGWLKVRVTRVGEETTFARITALVTQAQAGKAPVERIADKISAVFVPAVITIAILVFAAWALTGHSFEISLTTAITVIVVACPCALGLATPTALLVGSTAASSHGALIRGPEILENAHRVSVIVLDKTGTLTSGNMKAISEEVINPHADIATLYRLAASIEAHSEHPLARAVITAARERDIDVPSARDTHAEAGFGMHGIVGNEYVWVGSAAWLAELGADVDSVNLARFSREGASIVVVAKAALPSADVSGNESEQLRALSPEIVGVIGVRDTARPQARELVAHLRENGIEPVMATGDNQASAQAVAEEVGIRTVYAGLKPGEKVEVIRSLQRGGTFVAMVGDGLNDAAALTQADLSLAMGSGTDVAKEASDITLVNSDIRVIADALRISRATLRIIHQNLGWAFAYNLIAIPVAAAGFIMPGIAAAAMASSSVIVVLNSLRLRRA